ncbi:IclR family transcriptional regulator [Rhodoligotrophos appendicifer]|uniref:IclR family transcriptional regulator n=1 Tax=Rhodoligotrophos appendicifer TaxID=987056 RepID=UPI0011858A40
MARIKVSDHPEPAPGEGRVEPGTGTLDLALRVVEFLAHQPGPVPLTTIAKTFEASKATVYRHLQTLIRHGFARRDPDTGRYEVGIKLVVLGEAARNRFDVVQAARDELIHLRDKTAQAVTICSAIDNEVVVLELIQGQSVIEFGTRPGTRMKGHASAHGKIWLAFGPKSMLDHILSGHREAFTTETVVDDASLRAEIAAVQARGWSVAPNEVVTGVNALAAPIFDHRSALVGSVAIVGSTQFIPAQPEAAQVETVVETARRISRALGWRQT